MRKRPTDIFTFLTLEYRLVPSDGFQVQSISLSGLRNCQMFVTFQPSYVFAGRLSLQLALKCLSTALFQTIEEGT